VSVTHFRRLFRQFAGLPPRQYLIQRRLRLAAERLVETNDLVRQIAAQTGFHSEFYFSRLFKQTYRLSPLEYRRELTPVGQRSGS
jgi:AraC-like DNA-binding protein